jgi:hypothetical protein
MKRKAHGANSTIIHKNVVYQKWMDDNGCSFYCPLTNISEEEPLVRWNGGKIPWETWVNLCAHCEQVSAEESSECQFQLFYHDEEKTFIAWAFPQQKKSGMTTKELVKHPDFIKQLHDIRSKGFYPFGTVHTHDKMGAFQSSVDHKDEMESEGLHITLGKISSKEPYDIHARFTAKRPAYEDEDGKMVNPSYFMLPVEWTDFIQTPDSVIADRLPSFIKKKILETLFLRPDVSGADTEILKEWMDNRIEEDKKKSYKQYNSSVPVSHPMWNSRIDRHGMYQPPVNWWEDGPSPKGKIKRKEEDMFPDWEGSGSTLHSAIEEKYCQHGAVNDPDVNEDMFKAMQPDDSVDIIKSSIMADDCSAKMPEIKSMLIDLCEDHAIDPETLLDLLVVGKKDSANDELLAFLQESLEQLMFDVEAVLNVTVHYPDLITALEEMVEEQEKEESTRKQKHDITKRKKLKHLIQSK